MKRKVITGQTTKVVINIADKKVSFPALYSQLNQWPIMGLDKVIFIKNW